MPKQQPLYRPQPFQAATAVPTGIWSTESPVDEPTVKRHRLILYEWFRLLPEPVILRACEVWIEGILWEYRRV